MLFPGYVFKGRTYKTVNGLSTAIFKDCGCSSHSMVNKDRRILAYAPDRVTVIASYKCSAPEFGKTQSVEREMPKNA
jgi:hypothetical protein